MRGTWEDAVRSLLGSPEAAAFVRDCYYDQPPLQAAERFANSAEWTATRAWLPPGGGRALDIGAGNGISTYALARDGWRVTALEPDPSDLVGCGAIRRLCDLAGVQPEIVTEFAERLPFADAQFDLVFARQVMHHARDLEAFCREVARVLVPGGTFVAVRDHVVTGPDQLQVFLDSHPLHRLYGGENAFTLGQYQGALRAAGLVVRGRYRSFDSVVNYAPQTETSIGCEVAERLRRVPIAPALVRAAFGTAAGRRLALRALSAVDDRPGRLASFVAVKPPGGAA